MELELIEPELYFECVPEAAHRMAHPRRSSSPMIRALVIALALPAALVAAQRDPAYPMRGMLREWVDAVVQHDAGESDRALATIAWSYNDLELMQPFFEAFAGTRARNDDLRAAVRRARLSSRDRAMVRAEFEDRLFADADRFRRRAAILHTDAAIFLDLPAVTATPGNRQPLPYWVRAQHDRRVDVLSKDADYQSTEYSNLHWELAMDMLDAVRAPRDPFVAQWFATIGAYLVDQRRYSDALAHFARAHLVVPDDPRVLFAEARLHEALAAPLMQNFVRVTAVSQGVPTSGIDDQRTELRRAEGLLRRTLVLDPPFLETRLRLAHVLIEQGKHDEGRSLAEHVAAKATDQTMQYYALLFAGDALFSLGRTAEAGKSYQRAIDLFPDAQAARLGLASTLRSVGDTAQALDVLMPTITKPRSTRKGDDPWWEYYDGDATQMEALLEALRAPFRTARQ
jgi:tetratricopeptide (TPR) repeat protein